MYPGWEPVARRREWEEGLETLGLWRAVVGRSRSDWPVVLAAALLLLCATTLLATGALYADAVALGGLRRTVAAATAADRAVIVATTGSPRDAPALDGIVRGELARSLGAPGGEVARIAQSGSFARADEPPDAVRDLVVLGTYDAIERHAMLVDGRWPVPGRDPREATLSAPAANSLGLRVGDTVGLVNRLDPSVVVRVVVTGTWTPDPTDAYWAGVPLELEGVDESGGYVVHGPFVLAPEDLFDPALGSRLELQWRGLPAVGALRLDDIEPLRRDLDRLDEQLRATPLTSRQFRVTAALPTILDGVSRQVLVSRSGILLLTVQFAVLAGYAVVLVGGLLLERRRAETALLRSRGAGARHLAGMALGEALLLAIPATIAAPFLALGIVGVLGTAGPLAGTGMTSGVELTPAVVLIAAVAGLASVMALALPVLGSGVSLAGVRAAIGRQTSRTLPQRLGLDLVLVILAGAALWQLRAYGAPLTRNARGVLGVDPLLVAAPSIGLLAGAVLALRIVPRVAEVAERVLARRRGLVAPLGGRQLARRPLRYTRSALLLMLAIGLGTFASAHAATWARSQVDQAGYRAAADVRVVVASYPVLPAWAIGPAYRAIPGVTAAVPVTRGTLTAGRSVRDGTFLALDPERATALITFLPGERDRLAASLTALAAKRPTVPLVPLPGEPRRLSVALDAHLDAISTLGPNETLPDYEAATWPGVAVAAVVVDGDGLVHRFAGTTATFESAGQRVEITLANDIAGEARMPAPPLALAAIEIAIGGPSWSATTGTVDLTAIGVSEMAAGDAWRAVPLDPGADGWAWDRSDGAEALPYEASPQTPGRIVLGEQAASFTSNTVSGTTFRLVARGDPETSLSAIAGARFLELTGARVGDRLSVSLGGQPTQIVIAGAAQTFPPLDPDRPFLIVDGRALAPVGYAATGHSSAPEEWWLATDPGHEAEVVAALARPPNSAGEVVGRTALAESLAGDPVSLGVIGVLGLGSLAAMVFAAIGFVVSATVSTSERIGEFALLRALGLSSSQLSVWLSLESAFLLGIGLVAGAGLGVLLAWLVLPFATLTSTGAAPVPTPVVVVPWQALLPLAAVVAGLLVVTIVVVRRQVPATEISAVLRVRDG